MTRNIFRIRNAGFEDAAAIFKLIRQNPAELLPRPVSDIVENIDRFVVAESGHKIVGTVSWQILPDIGLAKDPTVEIKSLAVLQSHRAKGLGRALIRAAIDRILVLSPAQVLVLTFYPDFFARFGFRQVPKRRLMHKLYMGCLNCAKYDSPFTCPEVAMCLKIGRKTGKRRK